MLVEPSYKAGRAKSAGMRRALGVRSSKETSFEVQDGFSIKTFALIRKM